MASMRDRRQALFTERLRSEEDFMGSFVVEFWLFLRARKKLWLAPMLITMALFGALLVGTQGSAVAPFIYTLF